MNVLPVLALLALAGGLWSLFRSTGTERQQARKSAMLRQGDSWALVGDSIAVGLSSYLKSYAYSYHTDLTVSAEIGTTVLFWYQTKFDGHDRERDRYQVIVVSLGSNDAFIQDVLSREGDKWRSWVTYLKSKADNVVWIWPPMFGGTKQAPSRAATARLILESGVTIWRPPSVPMQPDGVHPMPEGYHAIAEALFSYLTRPS